MNKEHHIDLKTLKVIPSENDKRLSSDQYFYGHGKVLLTGEYLVLDGAETLALPTKVGQSLTVKYSSSFSPKLKWKSYDVTGQLWFECSFEFWHFNILEEETLSKESLEVAKVLQKLLKTCRVENKHFLRDDQDVLVETKLGFPIEWGLGSSSTLIYNIAQWAYVSAFELFFKTQNGSGYDIACAQSLGPITYRKGSNGPNWAQAPFDPSFKDNLFFVYLGQKKDSTKAVDNISKHRPFKSNVIQAIGQITQEILKCQNLEDFERLIETHETIIAETLEKTPLKADRFADYPGAIKSLGAWGGDFFLATNKNGIDSTREYFMKHGLGVVMSYDELIIPSPLFNQNGNGDNLNIVRDTSGQLH
jgi:mevalonate kinase